MSSLRAWPVMSKSSKRVTRWLLISSAGKYAVVIKSCFFLDGLSSFRMVKNLAWAAVLLNVHWVLAFLSIFFASFNMRTCGVSKTLSTSLVTALVRAATAGLSFTKPQNLQILARSAWLTRKGVDACGISAVLIQGRVAFIPTLYHSFSGKSKIHFLYATQLLALEILYLSGMTLFHEYQLVMTDSHYQYVWAW
jgi:hypothetical protein